MRSSSLETRSSLLECEFPSQRPFPGTTPYRFRFKPTDWRRTQRADPFPRHVLTLTVAESGTSVRLLFSFSSVHH